MTALTPFDEGYVAPAAAPPPPPPAPPPGAPKPARPTRKSAAPKAEKPAPAARPASRPAAASAGNGDETEYPTEIADGVYFGMIDDAYHAIERLSCSGIQKLLVSPANFWAESWLNPAPLRVEISALVRSIGRAYHSARLEPDLFARNYVRALDKAELPEGALVTGADMGAALAEMGLAKSGSVSEQAARLRANGYEGVIWQVELEKWEARRNKRIAIPAVTFDEIVEDGERLRASPAIAELLSGGAAEVSVFWTCPKTGIKMKARIDYLKPLAWIDFKTFDNSRGKVLNQAIADAFRYNRYYVQAVLYREAVEAIRNGLVDLVGDATDAQRDLLAAVQLNPAPLACYYVFQEKKGIPNVLARRFRFDDLPLSHEMNSAGLSAAAKSRADTFFDRPSLIARKATTEIEHAKRLFIGYSEIYERGEPWLPFDPIGEIGDEDFNSYWLEGAE